MSLFSERPAQRLTEVLFLIICVVTVAAMAQEFVGWGWGLAVGIAAMGALLWWSSRPSRDTLYRVSVVDRTLELVDPNGLRTSVRLDDVAEIQMAVDPPKEDAPPERRWLLRVDGRVEPVDIPYLAQCDDSFFDWLDTLSQWDSDASSSDEPGRRVVWSRAPDWVAPPRAPRAPFDPRLSAKQQWKTVYALLPLAAFTSFLAHHWTDSVVVAALVAVAWLVAIWFATRRNHPGIGFQLAFEDGVFELRGRRGLLAMLPADTIREIAFERRRDFIHGEYTVIVLVGEDDDELVLPVGTAGGERLVNWIDTLPVTDRDQYNDALYASLDDRPGVRRVAWSRP